MALPSSLIPSTSAEVIAENDALKASTSFRRLPAGEMPSFLVSLASSIASNPVDPKKLYSRNLAKRQAYYNHLISLSKKESSLLILAIKYDKLDSLKTPSARVEYIERLSHLVMIFMGKYNLILKDVPKTDIIANKLGKDVYFHIVKRLPEILKTIQSQDQAESSKAFSDALYYIKSSVMNSLTRFISILLGELASSGNRPDIDKREFKREQKADRALLKEDFRKNKKFYKSKWSALRNEASATLSNLDIEASVSSNSSKTRDILNERRARIDNFVYSLEQGIQSINSNNFEGFVSAKVAIEDSLIEYSKRLEFRTLAKKSRDIDAAFATKNKTKPSSKYTASSFGMPATTKATRSSGKNLDGYVHGVLKHLGPAGLSMYAGYKLINNRVTRTLIGKPLKYLATKAASGLGYGAKYAGNKAIQATGELASLAISLASKGLPIVGSAISKGARSAVTGLGTKASTLYKASIPSKSALASMADRAMYKAGYGVGASVRELNNGAGLLSKLVGGAFSPSTLASPYPRTEPETTGLFPESSIPTSSTAASSVTTNTISVARPPPASETRDQSNNISQLSKPTGFPLQLLAQPTKLPVMKSGLSSPRADLYIDDILERIDEHVPYIPADLTENDFSLSELKEVVIDALEEFLQGTPTAKSTAVQDKSKLSTLASQSTDIPSLVSVPVKDAGSKYLLGSDPVLVPAEHIDAQTLDIDTRSKISDLVHTNQMIQVQLEELDRQLDKILAKEAKSSAYNTTIVPGLPIVGEKIESLYKVAKITALTTTKSLTDNIVTKLTTFSTRPKSEDEIIEEQSLLREERSDRRKLVSSVQQLARSKSRSSQLGSTNLLGLFSSPLVSGALKSIESVLGGGAGKIVKNIIPSILKYAPRLASFAMPAIAIAGSAYSAWQLGSVIYDKYATDILDAIDSVISTATNIVQDISSWYTDYIVKPVKETKERLSSAGTKLSDWWKSNPVSRGSEYVSKNASRATGIVSEKVGQVGSRIQSGVSSVVSATGSVVDSIKSSASGAKTYVSNSVGKLFSTNHSAVDFDSLDPAVKSNFEHMASEYRTMGGSKPLSIESARRTTEQQAKLYEANPNLAAKPGRSLHEQGRALDIDRATAGELESMGLLSKYGFARNVKGEPWHISYIGSTSPVPASTSSSGPNIPSTRTQPQSLPTSSKPAYISTPSNGGPQTQKPNIVQQPAGNTGRSAAINTFSFLDSSFFIMNAGMMAS